MTAPTPSSEIVILRELLAPDAGFVSGSALAAKLGVSRVAVWQHMEKLRSQGFGFQAVRARGYRLTRRPKELNQVFIEALLDAPDLDCDVLLLDEVDSTNDEAARQLAAGRQAPFVVIARRQTKGRGRFGRTWHSERTGNLYASFGFRPQLTPEKMQTFTLWMGVCVCDQVAEFCTSAPGLKWPNDLLFDSRKAGGMLTEARMDSDMIRDLVFGLGLNLHAPANAWPDDLAKRATALSEHATDSLDFNRVTAALVSQIVRGYRQFVDGSYRKTFADQWQRFDLLRGKPVAVLQGSNRVAGTAMGVDDEGALLIREPSGRIQRFRAGEVTIEKSAS